MRKNIIKAGMAIAACMGAVSMGITVFASADTRGARLQSRGALDYNNKTIYLDSADLYYLADQIDQLESAYKTETVTALNQIGTYFKQDGSVVYSGEENEVDDNEKRLQLGFDRIMEGIKQSQSVVSLTQTQAVDKDGNPLYYADEVASQEKDLLKITTSDTGHPVYYSAAAVENLSAGTAAWINGNLIRGNGGDNARYYTKGFLDGQKNITDNLQISYTYHTHTGDSVNGGGCYTTPNTVQSIISYETVTEPCNNQTIETKTGDDGSVWDECSKCGGRFTKGSIGTCYYNITYQKPVMGEVQQGWKAACGKTDGQIESATITY